MMIIGYLIFQPRSYQLRSLWQDGRLRVKLLIKSNLNYRMKKKDIIVENK